MIDPATILDPLFVKLSTAEETAYFDQGTSKYLSLCAQYGIDDALIPIDIPFTPARIQALCTLIVVAQDRIGSEWRQIREGFTIDVYAAKLKALNEELNNLLANFTPSMCGYTDTSNEGTSASINWERA